MNPSDLTRNDFPDFTSILDALQDCDIIKYAAYRTAAKLRLLQGALFTYKLPLRIISNIFERHNLYPTENSVYLDKKELEPVLHDIYFVVKKEYHSDLNISHAVSLMTKYLLNVFDRKNKNSVQVLCSKIGLAVLCGAKPREKYQYLFNQLADHNSCLSKKKLEILLKKILYITEYVNEEQYFKQALIPGTVESCFQNNSGTLGVSEDEFISWLVKDPQILVWLSTLYRMQLSEMGKVHNLVHAVKINLFDNENNYFHVLGLEKAALNVSHFQTLLPSSKTQSWTVLLVLRFDGWPQDKICHNAKCAVCGIYPVVGLRYRCLRCLCYNQCQSCFFTGKFNKKHKLTHPVQEYCFQVTSRQSTKAFLLTIKNRLLRSNSKPQYLPAEKMDSLYDETLGRSTKLLDDIEVSCKTVVNGSRVSLHSQTQRELHSIIVHLEKESEKIIPLIEKLCSKKDLDKNECQSQLKKCLLNHKDQVEQQVRRLKLLKDYLVPDSNAKVLFESTPVADVANGKMRMNRVNKEFEGISPIAGKRSGGNERNLFLQKMMWDKYDIVNGTVNTSWEELKVSRSETESEEMPVKVCENAINHECVADSNEVQISTWLGGSTLKELDYSTNKGFTRWLNSGSEGITGPHLSGNKGADELRLQNEKYLRDIESDLEEILNKLQKLTSNVNCEKDNMSKPPKSDEDVMSDIDSLLMGLINGIDKLMSN